MGLDHDLLISRVSMIGGNWIQIGVSFDGDVLQLVVDDWKWEYPSNQSGGQFRKVADTGR